MLLKERYTKIFLKEITGSDPSDEDVSEHLMLWWFNQRAKEDSGLRLTKSGLEAMHQADIKTYEIKLPKNTTLTPAILVFLDQFMAAPFYVDAKKIVVTCERKAVELSLFSGDLRKYGVTKALRRHNYVKDD